MLYGDKLKQNYVLTNSNKNRCKITQTTEKQTPAVTVVEVKRDIVAYSSNNREFYLTFFLF